MIQARVNTTIEKHIAKSDGAVVDTDQVSAALAKLSSMNDTMSKLLANAFQECNPSFTSARCPCVVPTSTTPRGLCCSTHSV